MRQRRIASVLLAFLLSGVASLGDEAPSKDDAAQKERLELMKRQAAEYEVTLDSQPPGKLALHGEPLLRFSNPVGGVPDGIAVMWKEGERPAVFAQVFQIKDGRWVHEFQSVASAGLSMRLGEATRWKPQEGAMQFSKLPDAPAAAESAAGRLLQMKEQAARFSADDDFRMNVNDRETSRYRLRMLPKPVYRYRDADHGVQDGVVFAFVHGTDPELFLSLEIRKDGDKTGWFYQLAPMTCWAVTVQLGGSEVWSVPERLGKTTRRSTYHAWLHRPGK
jgi:hypothetical protein